MTGNTLYIIALLSAIWIIMFESLTIPVIAAGIAISVVSVYICRRLLPFQKMAGIDLLKFSIYPFYLIGQVYLSAFNAMKLIITGADVDIIEVKTKISGSFLRTIFANSITLTPGTISLELKDDTISVIWLNSKKDKEQNAEKAEAAIKNNLERVLLWAEK